MSKASTVINFSRTNAQRQRPKTFTKAEEVLDEVRERLHMDGRTQKAIAAAVGVSQSTVGNIASGKTRWPRPTTLFPMLTALRLRMRIEGPDDEKRAD
jgi:transcriptional regulator with XRE-family HTH domain